MDAHLFNITAILLWYVSLYLLNGSGIEYNTGTKAIKLIKWTISKPLVST